MHKCNVQQVTHDVLPLYSRVVLLQLFTCIFDVVNELCSAGPDTSTHYSYRTSSYSHQKVTSLAYLISYFLNIVTKLLYQLL